jgi:hypothetical protein
MEEKINEIVFDSIEKLKQNLINKIEINQIFINKNYFDEKYRSSVNITKEIKDFEALLKINKPVLYWFEFENFEAQNKEIRNKYENCKFKL